MSDGFPEGNIFTKYFVKTVMVCPKLAPYLFYLRKRSKIKYNFQCAIGEQGSGKSMFELVQGLILDPAFDIEKVIFSTVNLMDALDDLENRTYKGRFILWDDAGVGLPSDEWFTASNKAVHAIMQTVRTLHPTIAFTAPNMSYIDKKTRMVFTSVADCIRNVEDKTNIRLYTAKRMSLTEDIVYRKFCFQQGVAKLRYGEIRMEHLPEEYWPDIFKEYKKISDKFKFDSRRKVKDLMLTMRDNKLQTTGIEDYSTLTMTDLEKRLLYDVYLRLFNEPRMFLNKSKKIDIEEVQAQFHVNYRIARTIKRYLDAKVVPGEVKKDLGIEEIRQAEQTTIS